MLVRQQRGVFLKRILAITWIAACALALISAAQTSDYPSARAQTLEFQLTLRNITERQPISPPIVVVHDSNAVLLPSTAERIEGLEEFAESGAQPALMQSLSQRSRVKRVLRFGGVLQPQSQQTLLKVEAEPGDHISVIGSLRCTNDAIVTGTAIATDSGMPAFGSAVVWDAGTENNDESRATVPCLDGEGVSNPDTADGEGSIERHPGLSGDADLGDVFRWDRTVLEIVVDQRGAPPRKAFEVGATLVNQTRGQPITSPVVVVHDKNADLLTYTRPRELLGIDKFSEGGDGAILLDTLSEMPGVVSVRQWHTVGPIAPGDSYSNNVRAFVGNTVSVLGMFACTNDGYVVASAEVGGSALKVNSVSPTATVFDSGAENNDETAATVPCLGGDAAAFSEVLGENGRREHPGIIGIGDLDPVLHGWNADMTAMLTLHSAVQVEPTPVPTAKPDPEPTLEPTLVKTPQPIDGIPPDTGGTSLPAHLAYGLLLASLLVAFIGLGIVGFSNSQGNTRIAKEEARRTRPNLDGQN
jgi:hypothetical protein